MLVLQTTFAVRATVSLRRRRSCVTFRHQKTALWTPNARILYANYINADQTAIPAVDILSNQLKPFTCTQLQKVVQIFCLTGLPWELNFTSHTHPISTEKLVEIPTEFPLNSHRLPLSTEPQNLPYLYYTLRVFLLDACCCLSCNLHVHML